MIKEGGATLERKFTKDPITGEEITTDFSSVISPDRSGGGSSSSGIDGTGLTPKVKDAFDNLLNPKLNIETTNFITGEVTKEKKSKEQIKTDFSANVNQIANDVFKDSKLFNWFRLKKKTNNGKFPNPRDLVAEGKKELTEGQQKKLGTFLDFYELFFDTVSQEGF